jgi:hypothetical protein
MGTAVCKTCDAYVDSKDGTGLFDPRPGKTGFWCEPCVEAAIDEPVEFKEVILALKIEDPSLYHDAMFEWVEAQAKLADAEANEQEAKH